MRRLGPLLLGWCGVCLAGCTGAQSALAPAGRDAARIFDLFMAMAIGATVVWGAVIALAFYATRLQTGAHDRKVTRALIVGGGGVVPTVVLGALLVYGLAPLPEVLALPPPGGPVITVTGHQWWWRVRYEFPDGRSFDLANELRLPVHQRVEVRLESADVVHSFWLPSLAGKMDLVPGRVNRLALEPTRTGVYRGACAEYCGTSHARMNFYGVVLSADEFAAWTVAQLADAGAPADQFASRGQAEFLRSGCGACHTVRGTAAIGRFGPDLTHVGGRVSIGAGMLPTQVGELQRWIEVTERVKPGVHMPSFSMLPPDDVRAIATYLAGLR